jgi:uncharacterized membrane protein YcaP (DUF421 family)
VGVEPVLRAVAVYVSLIVLFRVLGNRALGQITSFDFVLLLIISEAIQNGLVGTSYSVVNALVLVTTLITLDVALSLVKQHWPRLETFFDGAPLVVVDNGRPLRDRMNQARVDDEDVLAAARREGLERMTQVKYAVLERNGAISIIPRRETSDGRAERPAT